MMSNISQLQRRLEMMETEYKLVDKTRVKALQVKDTPLVFKATAVMSQDRSLPIVYVFH